MPDQSAELDFTEYKARLLVDHLREHVEGEVRFDRTTRLLYSTDASIYQIQPLGVVIPKTVDDLLCTVQISSEMRIPITARGGGTSLSGQSIGPGIVIDCSKYLNKILDYDPQARKVRIQPGVVLDQLNRKLLPDNLQFGPDVATASRANLGGMIGNNSAGAHSIVYGKTMDHVRSLRVLLSDASHVEFGSVTPTQWQQKSSLATLEGKIYRQVSETVQENAAEIRRRFPQILRRVSGYNLDVFARDFSYFEESHQAQVGLHSLLVGSEGTLGITTEAELNLVERPKAVGLLVPHFDSLHSAMQALSVCLELKPSAVELLDRMLIELAQNNLSMRDQTKAIYGKPASLLMVELTGENEREVADKAEKAQRQLEKLPGVTAVVSALDKELRLSLWNLRKAAMPLYLGIKGDRKPVTFVEDAAVSPERLPHFVTLFREILRRHQAEGAFYGHASVGCLHIRPLLDLKNPAEVAKMRQIMEEVTDLVLAYGGSLSGEHGDGLVRSEWNKKMFGDKVYDAFCRIKQTFDPENLLNPGKVVHAPSMTENLRYGNGYKPAEPITLFDYSKQEGFVKSIEMCNGSGVCRRMETGTMCPSFRATMDEKDSTRGRANALRLALASPNPAKEFRGQWVKEVLDLCLMCKACKSECPSNVDMAKLKSEFLHFHYRGKLRPAGQYAMARVDTLYRYAAKIAPVVRLLGANSIARWFMEKLGNIDRRRSLPPIHRFHFRKWFARHTPLPSSGSNGKVLLLDDCFTTFNEPEIGQAAVKVLEAAGYEVELAGITCCCRPMISKGYLPQARRIIHGQMRALAGRVSDDLPIVGLEPSCLLTLSDEWPELAPSKATQKIAGNAFMLDDWLVKQIQSEECRLPLRPAAEHCVVHGHCHQKALAGLSGTRSLLQLIPEMKVDVLNTGCCGMAGSFGYEKEHYDLSVAIAGKELLPALKANPESTVVAPGTSCRHQINDLTDRRPFHPLEVVARQLESAEQI